MTVEDEDNSRAVRRAWTSASRLQWLQSNGCDLSAETRTKLQEIIARIPNWTADSNADADRSFDGRGGWVGKNTDHSALSSLPVNQILATILNVDRRPRDSFTENDPYEGLVRDEPTRALAVLSIAARDNNYPVTQWRTIIAHWPEVSSSRSRWVFANRLARLPSKILIELRHYLPRWLEKQMPTMVSDERRSMWLIWDKVFEALAEVPELTESSIGTTSVGGVPQERSRRTFEYALNSPIGPLANTLTLTAFRLVPDANSVLPADISSRLERCLTVAGEGGDHTVSMLTRDLIWYYGTDPEWTRKTLIPLFSVENTTAEPAWDAYLSCGSIGQRSLFALLKNSFLKIFRLSSEACWGERTTRRMGEFLVGVYAAERTEAPLLSHSEVRTALQDGNESCRLGALHQVWISIKETGWSAFELFFSAAWPMESMHQTSATSATMLNLAMRAGDDFPSAVTVLAPFLRPTPRIDTFIYGCVNDMENKTGPGLAHRFPAAVLRAVSLTINTSSASSHYQLDRLLEIIRQADPALPASPSWRMLSELVRRQ